MGYFRTTYAVVVSVDLDVDYRIVVAVNYNIVISVDIGLICRTAMVTVVPRKGCATTIFAFLGVHDIPYPSVPSFSSSPATMSSTTLGSSPISFSTLAFL